MNVCYSYWVVALIIVLIIFKVNQCIHILVDGVGTIPYISLLKLSNSIAWYEYIDGLAIFFSLMIYIHSLTFHIPPSLFLPAHRQKLTNRMCRKLCLLAYHTPVNYHDKWPASLCCWADQRQLLKSRQYTHTLASYSVCRCVLYRVVDVILSICIMYLNWGVSLWPSFCSGTLLQWRHMR